MDLPSASTTDAMSTGDDELRTGVTDYNGFVFLDNISEGDRSNGTDSPVVMGGVSNSDFAPALLPHLTLKACTGTSLYLLAPYQHGTVIACADCEVIIGAVAGALIISNCERVSVTVACRKLVVHNCVDCVFHVACTVPSVISGDSKHLCFGPHNTAYKHMAPHLRLANLEGLLTLDGSSSRGEEADQENSWSVLYDINSALDTVITQGSPSGYAVDAAEGSGELPAPPQVLPTYSLPSSSRTPASLPLPIMLPPSPPVSLYLTHTLMHGK